MGGAKEEQDGVKKELQEGFIYFLDINIYLDILLTDPV